MEEKGGKKSILFFLSVVWFDRDGEEEIKSGSGGNSTAVGPLASATKCTDHYKVVGVGRVWLYSY